MCSDLSELIIGGIEGRREEMQITFRADLLPTPTLQTCKLPFISSDIILPGPHELEGYGGIFPILQIRKLRLRVGIEAAYQQCKIPVESAYLPQFVVFSEDLVKCPQNIPLSKWRIILDPRVALC